MIDDGLEDEDTVEQDTMVRSTVGAQNEKVDGSERIDSELEHAALVRGLGTHSTVNPK